MMKKLLLLVVSVSFGFLTVTHFSIAETESKTELTIEELVSNPSQYDGKKILVEGVVDGVKYTKSSNGRPYTLFRVFDKEKNELKIYYKGKHLPLSKGDIVKVMGEFEKEKRYFLFTFKNVVRAKEVKETGVVISSRDSEKEVKQISQSVLNQP